MTNALSALSDAERAYDGPIPHRETILAGGAEQQAINTARGQASLFRDQIRDQIKAIRGWPEHDHLPPTEHGKRMARLFADLRMYLRQYHWWRGELMRLTKSDGVEVRRAA